MTAVGLHAFEVPFMHRPIDVRVDPRSGDLLVVDFGEFEMKDGGGLEARAGSGAVHRVRLDS